MTKTLELHVANLDCDHDAAALKRGFQEIAGVSDLQVLPKAGKIRLSFDPARADQGAIEAHLRSIGFPPRTSREAPRLARPWENPKVLTSAASGLLLLVGWLMARGAGGDHGLPIYFLASAVLGAWYFGREAIEALFLEHEVGIELLMLVAAIAAIVMGQAVEGAMLAFLYSISEAAEGYTEEKTRSAIRALMDLTPKTALVRRDGQEESIPVESLRVGDVFIVKPGQSIATDGTIEAGDSTVNQAPVTGESVPVHKSKGMAVFAGSVNQEGALEVRASKAFADNTVSRIIHMVEEAQEQKGHSQRFIEKFGTRYSPAVLLAGVLLAIVPSALTGNWADWIERATVFVVSAAPCALVISIPITLVATLGTGARRGVLIKGGVYVEELAKVSVVAVDKTGTLTRGEPEVTSVLVRDAESDAVLAAAAAVERWSQHPLARAVVEHARARNVMIPESTEFQSMTGLGAVATVGSRRVYVGSPELFAQNLAVRLDDWITEISRLQESGNTVVVVGDKTGVDGLISIRDNLRPNAASALRQLRSAGIKRIVMLTGDNERTVRAIAAEVGVDEVFADLKPEHKVEKVRQLSEQYGHVAMVGDGVNDAPALAAATVGVAMGAAGTDVALETADVALMADDLERLAYALELAKRNQRIVRQNLVLSTIVIGVLVIGAIAGVFNLPVAVLGHEISEFVVIGSGLRMLRS
jgi:Cd2+/Zn2+-exporting ATPase